MKSNIRFITHAAAIAALYVVLTLFISAFNLASGAIQIRISEALTILPFFTPAAVPGLFVGCLLANIITGCAALDVVFGSLATFLGAMGTYLISRAFKEKKISRFLAALPPILANTIIVPFVLAYVYQFEGSIPYFMVTVGVGEVLSCGVLGIVLLHILLPYRKFIFGENDEVVNDTLT